MIFVSKNFFFEKKRKFASLFFKTTDLKNAFFKRLDFKYNIRSQRDCEPVICTN